MGPLRCPGDGSAWRCEECLQCNTTPTHTKGGSPIKLGFAHPDVVVAFNSNTRARNETGQSESWTRRLRSSRSSMS